MNTPKPDTTSKAKAILPQQTLYRLWSGGGKPATRWRTLIGSALTFSLTWLAYAVALATLRWPTPLQLVGFVALAIAGAALIWSIVALWRVVLQLGIKRLIIRVLILYTIIVLIVGLGVPTGAHGSKYWRATMINVARWPVDGVRSLARVVIAAPEEINFAITGRRPPIQLPGIVWVGDVPPTPIIANVASADEEEPAPTAIDTGEGDGFFVEDASEPIHTLKIGDRAQVTGTEGASLRGRVSPSTSAKVAVQFRPGSILEIIDGPQTADGYTWWKVKNELGEGWCAAEFLSPQVD
jgi:hypothetical protein